jgi:Tfp pilus assembly PilM family ATPase
MSLRDTFLTAFPVPTALAPAAAGIDISSGSVKSIMLGERGGHAYLRGFWETPLPEGTVRGGDIEQKERIVEILRSIRLRNGIHATHACLPERTSIKR